MFKAKTSEILEELTIHLLLANNQVGLIYKYTIVNCFWFFSSI